LNPGAVRRWLDAGGHRARFVSGYGAAVAPRADCQLRISSPFHDDLQALLDEHLGRDAE
jgi:hypothetical protein